MLRVMTSKKGFTLIEIMIVVAMIGLVALIAVPALGQLQESRKAHKALSYARTLQNCVDLYKQEVSDQSGYSAGSASDRYNRLVAGGRWADAPASYSALNSIIAPYEVGIPTSLSDSITIRREVSPGNFTASRVILDVKKIKDLPGY